MDRKILVIDGLARSGTTLLSSMINSQKGSICYRGIFHEFLACDVGIWKKDYALHRLLDDNNHVVFKKNKFILYKYLTKLSRNLYLQYDRFAEHSLYIIKKKEQTAVIKLHQWEKLILSSSISSLNDVDTLYQQLAKLSNTSLFAMRWNQGLPYIRKFLRKKNHYWVTLIRNPMDRAISDYKTFNESFDNALKYTNNYGEILDITKEMDNHIVVYFEDIIKNPEKELIKIYNKIGISIDEVNLDLKKQSGQSYKIESSDLIDKGNKHTDGEKFSGFEQTKINKWHTALSKEWIDKFFNIIQKHKIYKRYMNR